jgi:hypothetical protein
MVNGVGDWAQVHSVSLLPQVVALVSVMLAIMLVSSDRPLSFALSHILARVIVIVISGTGSDFAYAKDPFDDVVWIYGNQSMITCHFHLPSHDQQ